MATVWYYTKKHFKENRDITHFPKCPPSEAMFKENYVAIPVSFGNHLSNAEIHMILSDPEKNMLTEPNWQNWLRAHGVGHTFMKVSDMIQRPDGFWMVGDDWDWIHCKKMIAGVPI